MSKRLLSDAIGVSERTLSDWQKEGMPIAEPAERRGDPQYYDVDAVRGWMKAKGRGLDIRQRRSTRPEQFLHPDQNTSRAVEPPPAAAAPDGAIASMQMSASAAAEPAAPAPTVGEPNEYLEHRAKREKFLAEQAELDYLQKAGLLKPVAEMRDAAFSAARTFRDAMRTVPDRLASMLAAETDPQKIHNLMSREIEAALNELSGRLARIGQDGRPGAAVNASGISNGDSARDS